MNAVIVAAVRTPFGRRGGGLADIHPADLLGAVQTAVLERSGVDPGSITTVIGGCAEKAGEQGFNIPRTAWLAAGLPPSVPAVTVDAQCGSSQEASRLGTALIASGQADLVLVCGVESMSRVPIGHTFFSGPGNPIPQSYLDRYEGPDQFASAEQMAKRFGISRAACDELAAASNERAAAAWNAGAFDDQIVREPLAPGAVHTKATASKLADGAAAVILASPRRAARDRLPALATITDSLLVGVEPELMLSGPLKVTPQLLRRNQLSMSDIDHWEVNEAFASIVLSWMEDTGADFDRVNPLGGAIAHGHPIGATGVGLLTKAAHALSFGEQRSAIVTMCCGGGLGTGTLLQSGIVHDGG
jgi:acetyl-CoA C-acetyltransferase